MSLDIAMVTFDCTDPDALAAWWSEAVGGTVNAVAPGEFVMVALEKGPMLGFQRVPDPTPGKNKVHLDFHSADKEPEVALVTAGVELDVLGFGYDDISAEDRDAVLAAYPRVDFKESIIQAFADGMAHRPETVFGTMNADVLAEKLPGYEPPNFCAIIRA